MRDLDRLNIPISLPCYNVIETNRTFRSRKQSAGIVCSGNASTNTSKTRGTSISKSSNSKQNAAIKKVDQIGTHNDNFLTAFVSHRNSEKPKRPKPKKKPMLTTESWFQEITNVSFDSDLKDDEYQKLVEELLPEFVKAEQAEAVCRPKAKPGYNSSSLVSRRNGRNEKSANWVEEYLNESQEIKLSEEALGNTEICKVTKWQKAGVQ